MTANQYPANWPDIACKVKTEADFACIRCHEPHNPKAGYTLTVHHLDGNKANCKPYNLVALCQRCHLKVQARVKILLPTMNRRPRGNPPVRRIRFGKRPLQRRKPMLGPRSPDASVCLLERTAGNRSAER